MIQWCHPTCLMVLNGWNLSTTFPASSFVYHRIISLTQSVGAMLWSMAQLRRGQLRMVVYVVGSCWWCGQLSVLARHTHMPHCPPVPTFSRMLFTDRPQFVVYLGSSSVFGADLPPWRLLLGPICGDVLGWVRMLPTPASTLPQSMHPSTGPQGWHLASPEPPCCRVYGTWVCMEALRSLWCRAGCASRVSLLSVPRRGWLLSALGRQGLSLLRQGAETQESAWDNQIWSGPDISSNHMELQKIVSTSYFLTCQQFLKSSEVNKPSSSCGLLSGSFMYVLV